MTGLTRLLHFAALIAWIGGWFAAMMSGVVMQRLDRSLWGGVADVQAALYRTLIGPGAMLAVLTGFALTGQNYGKMSLSVGPWLGLMQGTGILGALVILLGAMPAAGRLARLEPIGANAAAFDHARTRLALFGSIGGLLSVIALVAGAMYRG